MKYLIAITVLATLAGCASAPMTKEQHDAYAYRVCLGETANQQGVVISPLVKQSDRNYAMHECLYRHGAH
jgi:hypothetical protein